MLVPPQKLAEYQNGVGNDNEFKHHDDDVTHSCKNVKINIKEIAIMIKC